MTDYGVCSVCGKPGVGQINDLVLCQHCFDGRMDAAPMRVYIK